MSKIIYQTNIMPSGNSRSFNKLSEKLILNFQNRYELEKIKRVISSELITTYGLSVNENEVEEITKIVSSWYNK
ncbi:hypothetical protein H8K90_10505 [Winogradskyella echinorum]|uniref:Uncharacterized protein n=1 Tax=Winogradskyella echinorum TaxID=538189 RepID=A0ABR6Y269_9FLAO|nr:hypothetical protein [Winogradskyella echinorum]MBC3846810.1 hypothetical protein [Winogradskyella echinorum]MBC5751158.1 hypothetical protein [Winogradskyella echinorum]